MDGPIVLEQVSMGSRLLIQSYRGTRFCLTVIGDEQGKPTPNVLVVTINSVQSAHDFVVGRSAMLFAADLGDVSVEEAAEYFESDAQCSSIGKDYWVCLVQGELAGLLQVRSITFEE